MKEFYDSHFDMRIREDDLMEHVDSVINTIDELFDAMINHFSEDYIWDNLSNNFKEEVYQIAYNNYIEGYIEEVEEDENE